MTSPLDDLRRRIDEVDQQLVDLMSRRGEAAIEIGREKARANLCVHDAEREDAVFNHAENVNEGPLSNKDLRGIFELLVAACADLQEDQDNAS